MEKYLYHYTSIEALRCILKNRTIRFNNLSNMDDADESLALDFPKLREFCYSSSWSENEKESIPLWRFYSSDMAGVRIALPVNPFKTTDAKEHGKFQVENFSLSEIMKQKQVIFLKNQPELIPVTYTTDENLLKRKVIQQSPVGYQDQFYIEYEFIGKFKHENWRFQDECRYRIFSYPFSTIEFEKLSKEKDTLEDSLVKKMMNFYRKRKPLTYLDIEIDDAEFSKMQIITGPRMKEEEKIIVQKLVEELNPNAAVTESNLNIK